MHPKHTHANPYEPLVCCMLAMGICFCLMQSTFGGAELLFLDAGCKIGSAAHRHCTQLVEIFERNGDVVTLHVRPNHADGHGMRKGSATFATSGAACPPSTSAVANRGEWSLGMKCDCFLLYLLYQFCFCIVLIYVFALFIH